MKKYKSLVVSSLIAAIIVSVPVVSFAKSDNDNDNGLKVGLHMNAKLDKNSKRGAFFNRFYNWFSHHKAEAKTAIKVNSNPDILGIKAPTVLKVGEIGTWTVRAKDPQKGSLEYTIDWGDETSVSPLSKTSMLLLSTQNTTFTHAYASEGNYKITFTVTNDDGLKSTSTTTVKINGEQTTSAPVIKSLKGGKNIILRQAATITVNAYDPENGTLEQTADWGDTTAVTTNSLVSNQANVVQSSTFSHTYSATGTYTATFTVQDNEGKKDREEVVIVVKPVSTDTTNPIISALQILTGSTTGTISWKTDEPSTSRVFYSKDTPVDVNANSTLSVNNDSLVTNHSLNVSSLAPSTIYHFVIKSADASNNTAVSSEYSFITN